jgi:hypothetical protein
MGVISKKAKQSNNTINMVNRAKTAKVNQSTMQQSQNDS